MRTLDGKVAVVTGSGRGIGREIACKLARHGARVLVNDLDDVPAHETVTAIREEGGTAEAFVGNVVHPDFGERFVGAAIKRWGGLDIIVNNAGYTWDGVIQRMSDEQFESLMAVHVTAPFRVLRAAADFIRDAAKREAEEGLDVYRKVVNISSTSGLMGNPGQVNYSAAKAGISGLTRALAKEWGRYKVNVNSVAFGLIATRLTEAPTDGGSTIDIEGRKIKVGASKELIANMASLIPMGRPGTVAEAAGAVYLFCLPESNYISGQTLICGGGRP